jgi:hypothetical protein
MSEMTTTETVKREFRYLNDRETYSTVLLPVQKYIPVTQAVVFVEGHESAVILKDEGQILQAYKKGYLTDEAEKMTRTRNFNGNLNVDYSLAVDQTNAFPSIDWGIFTDELREEAELQVVDEKLFYVLSAK